MGTAQLAFAVVLCGGATGGHVTGSDVNHVTGNAVSRTIGSDVSHVTGGDHVRKYILRMRNRKLQISALVVPFVRK